MLGGILLSDRAMYGLVIEEGLKPDDFYRDRHRAIYEAMLELYRESEPIDVLTVSEFLRGTGKLEEAGGKAAIDELTGGVPGLGAIRRYAQIVREHALMRRLLSTTYEIQASVLNHAAAPRELIEQAERAMLEVAHDDRQKDFRTIDEILDDELKKMEKLSREGTSLTGTPSGFRDLDEITGGFQPGNLIVIAARPSMGKSALVTNIAENAAIDYGMPVALFSLEMSETELAQRFVASQGRIKGDELRKGRVPDGKWPKILKASAKLAAAPLYVDDSSDVGIIEIRAKARRLHQQQPLGLIIIDYLQLMRPDGRVESRVQQVSEMSRGLKVLARELNVPVIALSQLSRAVETRGQSIDSKRPLLSDLRECVTGDTPVMLADGRRRPIAELVGTAPQVMSVGSADRVVRARSDKVWLVGERRVLSMRLASGRMLKATPDHRVRTRAGWRTLGELTEGDRVAVARTPPEPGGHQRRPAEQVRLSGHPVGVSGAGGGATLLDDSPPAAAATDDLHWDRIVAVEDAGVAPVYDMTVPGPSCWLADGIVSHNSGAIEQDADLVAFIFREEYYDKETERAGIADIIIAKHRNGAIGDVELTFAKEYPKFLNYTSPDRYV